MSYYTTAPLASDIPSMMPSSVAATAYPVWSPPVAVPVVPAAPTSLAPASITTAAPIATAPSTTTTTTIYPQLCFEDDNLELYNAVDLYLNDPSPNSSLASLYGWPIGAWCVSNVTDFHYLFSDLRNAKCADFDADGVSDWDVSNGVDFYAMFEGSAIGTQNFSAWSQKLTHAEDMAFMFARTTSFVGIGLQDWNIGNARDTSYMFYNATAFNADISSWNVSNTISTKSMFQNAIVFDKDLGNWTLDSVQDMRDMFRNASSFSSNLCSWNNLANSLVDDTAAVTHMFTDSNCSVTSDPVMMVNGSIVAVPGPLCVECY
jgi:surface protein